MLSINTWRFYGDLRQDRPAVTSSDLRRLTRGSEYSRVVIAVLWGPQMAFLTDEERPSLSLLRTSTLTSTSTPIKICQVYFASLPSPPGGVPGLDPLLLVTETIRRMHEVIIFASIDRSG